MADEVILAKSAIVERCLQRIHEEYIGHEEKLAHDYTRQDAIILNLLRACEASIDLAMHVVRERGLGLPGDSREAFSLLEHNGLLADDLAARMRAMVGFRNVAVHDYRNLSLEVVRGILEERLGDFREFVAAMLRLAGR